MTTIQDKNLGVLSPNPVSSIISWAVSWEPNKLGLRNVMLSIVFIFLLNLAHDFCSLDHLNFYFSLFREIAPELSTKMTEISIHVLFIHHVTRCSYLHSTVTLVANTVEKKRTRKGQKRHLWFLWAIFFTVCNTQ